MIKARTGELLVQRGAVKPGVVATAVAAAKRKGTKLLSQLLAMRACDERMLVEVLAETHGLPGVDLSRTVIPLEALDRVPRLVAETDMMLPLSLEGGRLHLAMGSPREGDKTLAEVRFATGLEVSPYIAVLGALEAAIGAAYDARAKGETIWRGAGAGAASPRVAAVLPGGIEEAVEIVDDVEPLEDEAEPVDDGDLVTGDEPLGAAAEQEIEIAVGGGDEEVLATVSASAGPRRILVVDDEPEIRTLLQRTLAANGFQVESAADGVRGLEAIRETLPDLVLLDAMLPKKHGFEVCLEMRADPRTKRIPVIFMTAVYRGWRFAQDARETYGAEDYVEKPFHLDDLVRRVEAVLESSAARGKAGGAEAQPQFTRGKELLLAGQIDEAVAAFEEALRADPFSAEVHYQLARALRAKGDAFRAMTAYEKAVELRHGFFQALRSLAALYGEKGFRRKAAEALERALASAPEGKVREAIKVDLMRLL